MARRLSTACGPWFHGGVAGLDVGDPLLPGKVLGLSDDAFIYVTLDETLAHHAAGGPHKGDVYEVAVEFPTWPSVRLMAEQAAANAGQGWPPRMHGFQVRAASVVRVVYRAPREPGFEDRPLLRQPVKPRRRADG